MKMLCFALALLFALSTPGFAEVLPPMLVPPTSPSESAPASPDNHLAGKIIGVNAGHQRYENTKTEPIAPGSRIRKPKCAQGTRGRKTRTPEFKVTLDIALQLRDALQARGAIVVMAREGHNVNISNAQRAKIFNAASADLAIHLHCDAAANGVQGAKMYAPAARYTTKSINKQSLQAGNYVLRAMCGQTGAKKRGLNSATRFASLNYTKVPSMLFEMGFLSDAKEEKRLLNRRYQQNIVAGIVEGMDQYFAALES